jgi:tetratricopeptide (TPR) repeat protein
VPIGCVLGVLIVARKTMVMPTPPVNAAAPVIVPNIRKPYPPAVDRNYRFRIRQLQSDLARDPREYLLLSRLGMLHLRLARSGADADRSQRDYAVARGYFDRAARAARTRREYEWAMLQREACAERAPVSDMTDGSLQPDLVATAPPPSVDMEGQLAMRAQFLETRVRELPHNARLLSRLGLTYVRLSQAMAARERRSHRGAGILPPVRAELRPGMRPRAPWGGPWDPPADLAECRERARKRLQEALKYARSREIRAENYRALAELARAEGDLLGTLTMLRRVVEMQPNNWPAQLAMAAVLTRLGHPSLAHEARVRAERWRTPEWL